MRALRWAGLAALVIWPALPAGAEIEFAGYFVTAQEARFTLTDRDTSRGSGWLKLGQSFAGYTLAGFDPAGQSLTIRRNDESLTLPLRTARVQEGRTTVTGSIQLFGETIEGVQTVLFVGEENTFPLRDDVTLKITPRQRPDGSMLYLARIELRNPDGTTEQLKSPGIVARPGTSFGVRIGEVGFDFRP